jgi:hypothetical protein
MTREMFRSLTVKRERRGVVQVDRLATGGADRRVHGNLPKLGGPFSAVPSRSRCLLDINPEELQQRQR